MIQKWIWTHIVLIFWKGVPTLCYCTCAKLCLLHSLMANLSYCRGHTSHSAMCQDVDLLTQLYLRMVFSSFIFRFCLVWYLFLILAKYLLRNNRPWANKDPTEQCPHNTEKRLALLFFMVELSTELTIAFMLRSLFWEMQVAFLNLPSPGGCTSRPWEPNATSWVTP